MTMIRMLIVAAWIILMLGELFSMQVKCSKSKSWVSIATFVEA